MRLVTWNVNSLRSRLPRLLAMLEREQPDIVCLQETKALDDEMPTGELAPRDRNTGSGSRSLVSKGPYAAMMGA